jgi:predicted nuclease of predicted toxin-antitoxin system
MLHLLADENVPGETVATLRERGHEVAWVAEDAPSSSDVEIMQRALAGNHLVLTFDKDFGELVFRSRLPITGVILVRVSAPSPRHVTAADTAALQSRSDWAGYFSVVEDGRIRMTPLPKPR